MNYHYLDPHTKQYELEVQKIIHLQGSQDCQTPLLTQRKWLNHIYQLLMLQVDVHVGQVSKINESKPTHEAW